VNVWKLDISNNFLWISLSAFSQDVVKSIPLTGFEPQEVSRTTKSRYWSGYRKVVGSTEKACASKEALQTWLSYTSSGRRNGPKFTKLIVGRLWKATQNICPKLNNLKTMLPNTNWVYVNFWPTGNVMKEITSEINHSE
jgi:hypothetical protein